MIRLVDVYKAFGPKEVLQGFTLDVNEGGKASVAPITTS